MTPVAKNARRTGQSYLTDTCVTDRHAAALDQECKGSGVGLRASTAVERQLVLLLDTTAAASSSYKMLRQLYGKLGFLERWTGLSCCL